MAPRSRAAVWAKRLLVASGVTATGAYGGFYMWVRRYDPGVAGKARVTRVLVEEDGSLKDSTLRASSISIAFRYLQLACLYLPLLLTYHICLMNPTLSRMWQEWFIEAIQWSGPAFIKLAQWLATRRDLVAPEFRQLLSRLFDHVKPHPYEFTKQTIEADLGKADEIFEWIDEEPVGSGSIAQVHRAKLRDGDMVAVKVCHPHVRERIALDFHVLNSLARVVDQHFPSTAWMLLPRMALSWTTHLAQQIDLRIEAENLDFFAENFEGMDTDRFATFPKVIRPYVSTRVLVEEFVEAHTASDEYLTSLPMELRTHLAEVGMDTYLKFLLRDNWLHGDLHPGNILVESKAPEGKKWPRVYLVDCGLCQYLEPEEKETARMVLEGFAKWHDLTLAKALWIMGKDATQRPGLDFDSFHNTVVEVFKYYQPAKGSDSCIVGRLLEAMFDAVRIHQLQIDPQFCSLLFGALIQENFVMTLDGNFNIVNRVIPWLAGQGITSRGMFQNFTGLFWGDDNDVREELGPEMEKKGMLRIEGGAHKAFDAERDEGGKAEWKRGILEASH
eukprot:TRINITY_DN38035_c0_g1_i1.p1 TRINITY_DN38035_c0_g1~~TRINITY_DN38035_c0_g1_i1.p1  ORF type:complete len:574 (+),score=189.76 TRINITY_DN38035_c0_g1_i1:49-1722(+)